MLFTYVARRPICWAVEPIWLNWKRRMKWWLVSSLWRKQSKRNQRSTATNRRKGEFLVMMLSFCCYSVRDRKEVLIRELKSIRMPAKAVGLPLDPTYVVKCSSFSVPLFLPSVPSDDVFKTIVQVLFACVYVRNLISCPFRLEVKGLLLNKCKYMDSKKVPLWLVFENADEQAKPVYTIFKVSNFAVSMLMLTERTCWNFNPLKE